MGGLDIDCLRSAIAGAMLAPHGFALRDSAIAKDGPDAGDQARKLSQPPRERGDRTWLKLRHPGRRRASDFARGRLREAQRRDLFCCLRAKRRSLDYAARWAASLGMTE